MTSATSATADTKLEALKTRLRATWMDGNYDYFSRFMASSAAQLLNPLALSPGATLLDVACGSGRAGARRRRARTEGDGRRHRDQLDSGRARPGRLRGPRCAVRRRGRRSAAVPGRQLRRRRQPVRRDVRAAARACGRRNAPRLPSRGHRVHGQLDERGVRRRDFQDVCAVSDAARHAVPLAVGRRERRARALGRRSLGSSG